MNCSLPAPWFYEFVMHNLHFISTPIYIICLSALFRETSQVFKVYKYYIIAHIITNLTSEFYVTFMWLPITYLPYDVYRATGWLSQWGVSGVFQFYTLAQFIIVIGVSVLEMFHYRFHVVVLHREGNFVLKLPTYGLYIFRFFAVVHLITLTLSTIDDKTIIYQQNKKDALFKKVPDLPKELGCYSVFILATEDPILILNVVIYSILVCLGSAVGLSTVVFINVFLNSAKNLSKETKKLQRILIFSLLAQGAIHVVMIISPVVFQIYQMIFIMYDNNFSTLLLFSIAYHGFFSTCAMIIFTKQLRVRILRYMRCCFRQEVVPTERTSQMARPTTFIDTSVK
ncbi:unnamed protein product [Caenorhabditis nigoni]